MQKCHSPSKLSRTLCPQHLLSKKTQSRSCHGPAHLKPNATSITHGSPCLVLSEPSPHTTSNPRWVCYFPAGQDCLAGQWRRSTRAQPFACILHFRKLNTPASIQDRCCVMEQQHSLPSQQPCARTQHPTASLRLQPSLSFQFYLPHLPNSSCPLLALLPALPPP